MERVTNSQMVNNLIRTLNERMRTLSDLQNQLTTGKSVNYASDDPGAAGLILELRNHLRQNIQFQENVDSAIGWLTAAESTLQQLNEILTQARADAVQGSNEATTPEGMMALADEVNSYLENVFSLANEDYSGKFLFGGTNTDEAAFNAMRDPATDWIIGVTANPDGTSGAVMRQINTYEQMQINIGGVDLFLPNGAGGNEDMFQVLINLRDALQAGDVDLVGVAIPQIDAVMGNASDFTSLAGSRVLRLTDMQLRLLTNETNLTEQLSNVEDADLVSLMTEMTLEQNAYQAALNVGAMIIQPSLVNFM